MKICSRNVKPNKNKMQRKSSYRKHNIYNRQPPNCTKPKHRNRKGEKRYTCKAQKRKQKISRGNMGISPWNGQLWNATWGLNQGYERSTSYLFHQFPICKGLNHAGDTTYKTHSYSKNIMTKRQ